MCQSLAEFSVKAFLQVSQRPDKYCTFRPHLRRTYKISFCIIYSKQVGSRVTTMSTTENFFNLKDEGCLKPCHCLPKKMLLLQAISHSEAESIL